MKICGNLEFSDGYARIGYSPEAFADLTDTRLPGIRRFLKGQLDTDRIDELSTLMRRAGLPL
ncbi:hypothetical protein FIV00_03565 [Labrenzia sp. THAF82]|uniref:hypothetical protein n=1 Tax=Labrenzia sp. THAF82 TaxID=2587861 RepID=UPI001268750B|nr:hypothetical protein [Labrenzia sp. THAF82]QFT29547.1 hypothetical protein FIV00_03565 [Labrenzia sp. THAF82]